MLARHAATPRAGPRPTPPRPRPGRPERGRPIRRARNRADDRGAGSTRLRTALILQDLQNDVIMEGGAFAASGAPAHAKAQNVIANAARLAAAARAKGVMVIHVWMLCEPGHPYLAQHAPLFQGLEGRERAGPRHLGRAAGAGDRAAGRRPGGRQDVDVARGRPRGSKATCAMAAATR